MRSRAARPSVRSEEIALPEFPEGAPSTAIGAKRAWLYPSGTRYGVTRNELACP